MNETDRQAAVLRLLTNAQVQVEQLQERLSVIGDAMTKMAGILCLSVDVEVSELVEAVVKLKTENDELKSAQENSNEED